MLGPVIRLVARGIRRHVRAGPDELVLPGRELWVLVGGHGLRRDECRHGDAHSQAQHAGLHFFAA
eukprot:scaffold87284_cov67-Phaeocystis_antarctica.AAC.1